jgi:hypothetical protein
MRKAVLALILVAAPVFGQSRGDQAVTPVVFGAAPGRQVYARVASDGTNFLAVWVTRTQSTVLIGAGRISPAGEALDQPSILIASGVGDTPGYPDVVFAGGNFLVAYPSGNSILLRRFGRDGQAIGSEPTVIGTRGSPPVQLATNGTTVLLAIRPDRIRMLTADGTPLGAERDVPNAGSGSFSIRSNGDRYLIAYSSGPTDANHASLVLLGGDGSFLDTKPLPDSFTSNQVNVASNGVSFLVSIATTGTVECLVVDAKGNASAQRILDNQAGGFLTATWSGSEYTLVWARASSTSTSVTEIVGARVDSTGLPRDATPIPINSWANTQRFSEVFGNASNGSDTIIITGDIDNNDLNPRMEAIFASLPKIDIEPAGRRHVALGNSAGEQTGGSISSNGTSSLAAWREASGLYQAVARAAFVTADGQIGAPIDLGDAHPQSGTAVASDGRDFLVVYCDSNYRLVARRMTPEGPADLGPMVITPYGTPTDLLAVGWSGQSYVVVIAGSNFVTITGINAEGAVVVARQFIQLTEPADTPAISCDASGCSVTWHWVSPVCGGLCGYNQNDVFVRTDAAGNVLSQVLLTDFIDVTPAISLTAANGESMFIYSSGKTMYAGRITAAGTILDPPALNGGLGVITSTSAGSPQPIAAVNAGLYWVELSNSSTGRLYWSRIDPEPRPHVAALVDTQQIVDLPLQLAASARNTYLLSSRGLDDPSLMAPRLFVRTIPSPDPQTSVPRRRAAR